MFCINYAKNVLDVHAIYVSNGNASCLAVASLTPPNSFLFETSLLMYYVTIITVLLQSPMYTIYVTLTGL